MRTVCTKVFQYSELSESAQSTARDWWRRASEGDNFFSEYPIEDAARVADILGVEFNTARGRKSEPAVYWSGFSSPGEGASFTGFWRYQKGSVARILSYAPRDKELHRIARSLQSAARVSFYRANARITASGYYSHSGTMLVDCDQCPDTAADKIEQCMQDFADWIYCQLETAYEWEQSDENVAENIEANQYEFTEDGEIA